MVRLVEDLVEDQEPAMRFEVAFGMVLANMDFLLGRFREMQANPEQWREILDSTLAAWDLAAEAHEELRKLCDEVRNRNHAKKSND